MKQEYIISAYSENHIGLLNRITIIFTRRKVNIESITASVSAIEGISKLTIVVNDEKEKVVNITKQIEKQVDDILRLFGCTGRFIPGTADQVPPDADIELVKIAAERLAGG